MYTQVKNYAELPRDYDFLYNTFNNWKFYIYHSYIFLYIIFQSIYTMMTQEYGIPEWACYVIFAILTIVTGLVLGLVS